MSSDELREKLECISRLSDIKPKIRLAISTKELSKVPDDEGSKLGCGFILKGTRTVQFLIPSEKWQEVRKILDKFNTKYNFWRGVV